jgi:hypothetical protein
LDHAPGAELPPPPHNALKFILVERVRLYSKTPGGLRGGLVFHRRYPFRGAEVAARDDQLFGTIGSVLTCRPPGHTIMSRGVNVTVFPLDQADFSE